MTAGQDAGEQCLSASRRLDSAGFPKVVCREQLLIAFVLGPLDVSRVMILDYNTPLLKGLIVPVGLANSSIYDSRSFLAFAIDVGTGVKRVLQQPDDVVVADGGPLKAHHLLAIRRPWEMHPFG